MLLMLVLSACGSNDPDCLCDRGGDSLGTDDTAAVTDTDPKVFDPETDLEWHVVEGTDGDCGTPWPLGPGPWSYTSTIDDDFLGGPKTFPSYVDKWTQRVAAPWDDVWDVSLQIAFSMSAGISSVHATFRLQCDRGAILLLGVTSGSQDFSEDLLIKNESYAASFTEPIVVGLVDSAFEVDGQLWYSGYSGSDPPEADPATFSGTIDVVGPQSVKTPGGDIDALHIVISTDSELFIDVFPKQLWLSESAGLVQFDGPIGDTPSVIAN
jgi:hypothetical protein